MSSDVVFNLEPYVRVGPLKFGMSIEAVHSALGGGPIRLTKSQSGAPREHYGTFQVFFDRDGRLQEVSFSPGGASLRLDGDVLIGSDLKVDPIPILRALDAHPVVCLGFVIFFGLGISVTGFHDNDEGQRAVVAFRRGTWDDFKAQAVPLGPYPAKFVR